MAKYKKIFLNMAYFLMSLIIYLLIMTIFASLNVMSYKLISIMSFIYTILIFTFFGFKLARNTNKRGFLSGIFMGLANIFLMLLLSLIFNVSLDFKVIIYYLILIISSTLGGIVGINFKRK